MELESAPSRRSFNKGRLTAAYDGWVRIDEPEVKIIDVFICKVRKKLTAATMGKDYIETVWGRGYVLRDPQSDHGAVNAA